MAFLDDFTGTLGDYLSARAGWTLSSGSAGSLRINSGSELYIFSSTESLHTCTDQGGADSYVQWRQAHVSGTTSSSFVCLRVSTVNSFIGGRYQSTANGWQVYKRTAAASFTVLGSYVPGSTSGTDVGRIEASGNNVSLFVNGTLRIGPIAEAYNNTLTGHGLVSRIDAQSPWIDDFEAGALSAGGAAYAPTAWKILTENTKSAAWRIEAQAVRDLAYVIFGQASRTVAWDLLNQSSHSVAWQLLNQAQSDAAWKIQSSAVADAGWRILVASEQATAWQILASGSASVDVAWRVLNSVQQATAARILAQAQRDSGWAVLNQLSLDSGWAVLSAQQQQLLWRILAGEQVDTGWAVLNAISAASSWRVLAQQLMDAGWRISASAALDTAWAVDGIEAVSVESMVFRAGARTLVVDAKARTITFIP